MNNYKKVVVHYIKDGKQFYKQEKYKLKFLEEKLGCAQQKMLPRVQTGYQQRNKWKSIQCIEHFLHAYFKWSFSHIYMHTADNDPNQEYYNYPHTENVTRFNATAIYIERREFASPTFETCVL